MPNSFTVFPNVLPGNVTIGGNLTVSGDQVQIGAAAPFTRIGKIAGGAGWMSHNSSFGGGQDVASLEGQALFFSHNTPGMELQRNAANTGGQSLQAWLSTLFSDNTAHSHTGTTTEDTIYSKLIPANTLGANGGIALRMFVNSTANGAPGSSVRVKFGATVLLLVTFSATQQFIVEVFLHNRNAVNSNLIVARAYNVNGTIITTNYVNNGAVDFSVDETLTVTMQNGTSTDTQSFDGVLVQQLNSFGPV